MGIEPEEFFKAFSVKTRLNLIELLKKKSPIGAKDIALELGISTAAASQHLKVLRHIGLVTSKRDGFYIPYSLDENALDHCSSLLDKICSCGCSGKDKVFKNFKEKYKGFSLEELKNLKIRMEIKLKMIDDLIDNME